MPRTITIAVAAMSLVARVAFGQDACPTRVIGIDPSMATGWTGTVLGEGPAQTFLAADTLIRSITVWQEPRQWDVFSSAELYVVTTDSLGEPNGQVLGSQVLIKVSEGDGVHPYPFIFHFDPPLALPHPGRYAFQLFSCVGWDGNWLTRQGDPSAYPDGHVGYQNTRFACHPLGHVPSYPDGDMIFRIVFERAGAPVVNESVVADTCAVHLTWSAPDTLGALATVERRELDADWQPVASIARDGTGRFSFEDGAVVPGWRYEYSLDFGDCRFTGYVRTVVPGGLAVVFDRADVTTGTLRLAWTATSGRPFTAAIERRQVQVDDRYPVDETWRGIGSAPSDETGHLEFVDQQAVPGATYHYRLVITQCGHESHQALATFVQVPCTLGFPAPTAMLRPCEVVLAWSTPSGQAATLYRRRDDDSDWTAIAVVTSDGTGHGSYVDRQIATHTGYSYRIATKGCESGLVTGAQTHVVIPVPGQVHARVAPCDVRVSWASADVAGRVASLSRRSADGTWLALGNVVSDSLGSGAYDDTNVSAGGRYTYRLVSATCRGDTSSTDTTVTVPDLPNVSPSSIRAAADGVHVRWLVAGGVVFTATLYRRAGEGDWTAQTVITSTNIGRIDYEDPRIAMGERYDYRLGIVACGEERFVGTVSIAVPIQYVLTLGGVHPSPAIGTFTLAFSLPDQAPARLDILDLAGRRVLSREVGGMGAGQHLLDLTESRSLPSGVYLVRLVHADEVRTARAIFIR